MAENSRIEWTDHTFNPWIGCQKVGPGCDHCYAEAMMDTRLGRVDWGPHGARTRTSDAYWTQPLRWDAAAGKACRPARVFCASLADWADNHGSIPASWRQDLGDLITRTPNLIWLLLTKRVGNVEEALAQMFGHGTSLPRNIAVGITVVNQDEANRDVPRLLDLKSRLGIRWAFLSVEPMLGPVHLNRLGPNAPGGWITDALRGHRWPDLDEGGAITSHTGRLHWIICGGESGPGARPMHPDWARSLRDQCVKAGVPFFFKQWGEWELSLDRDRDDPDWRRDYANDYVDRGKSRWINLAGGQGFHGDRFCVMRRVGKKAAGRLLDGRTWDELPEVDHG